LHVLYRGMRQKKCLAPFHNAGNRIRPPGVADCDCQMAHLESLELKDQKLAVQLVVTKLRFSVTEKTTAETTSTVETKVELQPGSMPSCPLVTTVQAIWRSRTIDLADRSSSMFV
jgi:hypothetical protein